MAKQRPIAEILREFDGPQEREPMSPDEIRAAMGLWVVASQARDRRIARRGG